jgi:hypothetical protein
MSGLAEEKVRAREQWTQDPCGAVHGEHEFGTREFFDTVERHRYTCCNLRAVVRAAPASI